MTTTTRATGSQVAVYSGDAAGIAPEPFEAVAFDLGALWRL
jgi:hypothetical protein